MFYCINTSRGCLVPYHKQGKDRSQKEILGKGRKKQQKTIGKKTHEEREREVDRYRTNTQELEEDQKGHSFNTPIVSNPFSIKTFLLFKTIRNYRYSNTFILNPIKALRKKQSKLSWVFLFFRFLFFFFSKCEHCWNCRVCEKYLFQSLRQTKTDSTSIAVWK